MKRIILSIVSALAVILSAGARVYEVETGEYTKLKVPDDLNVVYEPSSGQKATARFEIDDKLADALMFVNNGNGELKVMISPDFIDKNITLPPIYLSSEFLTSIESSSLSTVQISHLPRQAYLKAILFGNGTLILEDIDVAKFTAGSMTGHGTIQVSGKTDDALLKVAGAGHIDANALQAQKVSCHVFGSGQIHCSPIDELKLKGLGSTTVYYSGSPQKIKKQGIGKLVHVGN